MGRTLSKVPHAPKGRPVTRGGITGHLRIPSPPRLHPTLVPVSTRGPRRQPSRFSRLWGSESPPLYLGSPAPSSQALKPRAWNGPVPQEPYFPQGPAPTAWDHQPVEDPCSSLHSLHRQPVWKKEVPLFEQSKYTGPRAKAPSSAQRPPARAWPSPSAGQFTAPCPSQHRPASYIQPAQSRSFGPPSPGPGGMCPRGQAQPLPAAACGTQRCRTSLAGPEAQPLPTLSSLGPLTS